MANVAAHLVDRVLPAVPIREKAQSDVAHRVPLGTDAIVLSPNVLAVRH